MLESIVIFITLQERSENSVQGMNKGKEIGRSVTGFCESWRWMIHINQIMRMLVTCFLADFAVSLLVWE